MPHEGLDVVDETFDVKDIEFNVDYAKMVCLLHVCVKDLCKKINIMQSTMDAMANRINELEKS